MNLTSRLAISLLMGASSAIALAVPAAPFPLEMKQPDGRSIMVTLTGDEKMHFYRTIDGLLLHESAEKGFVYAIPDGNGGVMASDVTASDPSARTPEERAFIAAINTEKLLHSLEAKRVASLPARADAERYASSDFNPVLPSNPIPGLFDDDAPFPVKGSPKVLVLLVNYSDVQFKYQKEYFHNIINGRNYTDNGFYGSVYDYYTQQSKNQFTPQFDVLGPVKLSGAQSYYGGNDKDGNDLRPREMVIEALKLLDDIVDFSQYDNNGDGIVDNIYVFYAGKGEASGGGANTIWPHSWALGGMSPTLDGVRFNSYACSNELNYDLSPVAIGTFCHEFGHVLGLPDLYATSYTDAHHPGIWDLMASGSYNNDSRTPPNLSSFERGALGWLEPEWLYVTGQYSLDQSILDSNKAYLIATDKANEFFLLENRANWIDSWDDFTPSTGMLVWHVDYQPTMWYYNIVNNDPDHMCVDIVEAHGKNYPVGIFDCYPFGAHTALTFNTQPALKSWAGTDLKVEITDIQDDEDTEKITFNVNGLTSVKSITDTSDVYKIIGGQVQAKAPIEILNINGCTVAKLATHNTIKLPSGIYLLRHAEGVNKVFITE